MGHGKQTNNKIVAEKNSQNSHNVRGNVALIRFATVRSAFELHLQAFVAHLEAVHLLDGSLRAAGRLERHEAEAFGEVGVPVKVNFGRENVAERGEHARQVVVVELLSAGQVIDKQISSFGSFRLLRPRGRRRRLSCLTGIFVQKTRRGGGSRRGERQCGRGCETVRDRCLAR